MAKRTDSNQAEITAALRAAGASVTPTHMVGRGFVDLVAGFQGRTYLIECKSRNGALTADEWRFHSEWRGSAVVIVRSVADALKALGLEV